MESNILNFHDLVLFISALSAFYLALMIAFESGRVGRFYLSAFLVLIATEALYLLAYYSLAGKTYIASNIPASYFLLITAFYMKGQALYFYVNAQLFKEHGLNSRALYHTFPLFLYVGTVIYSYDSNIDLYANLNFWQANFLNPSTYHLTLIAYSIATLVLLFKYKVGKEGNVTFSDAEKKLVRKLLTIAGAYLVIWLVTFASHTTYHITQNINIASVIGKLAIYLNFSMLVTLFTIFWRERRSLDVDVSVDANNRCQPDQDVEINLRKIGQLMEDKRLYLQPNMTLDRMANELETTPRALSIVLNDFYGINFYQYLNQNRIEEAKRLLERQDDKTQISSIYSLAGFTSRTTFNVKFKEFVGKTPSEYRRTYISHSMNNT